ncbi:MAG: hypothetical protein NUW06_01445 [Candidatus Acetothermia bacterium]|jgi:hypothetical protein|nr:hypothetical protein [Candidatus Acetothermia bacterium]MDH7505345.1 hypothetical protein [Candidatus Acetothermia bacterium]
MKELGAVAILIGLILVVLAPPAGGAGLEEAIFTVTLSGALAAGVELSWELTDQAHLRAGLALMWEEGFVPGAWGRAALFYTVNPGARLSFCAGGGLTGFVVFTEERPSVMALLEVPLGARYSLNERFGLLGELRLGLPWLNPLFGKEIPALITPLGLTAGIAYKLSAER